MKNEIVPEFVPKRQTVASAGYDIYANEDMYVTEYYKNFDTGIILENECIVNTFHQILNPKSGKTLPRINVFQHYVAMIFPRSSMGFKHGLKFANTVGIIDQDYRESIKISLKAEHCFTIKKGERYAQLVFIPIGINAEEVRPTKFREGGIGSTDVKPLEEYQ